MHHSSEQVDYFRGMSGVSAGGSVLAECRPSGLHTTVANWHWTHTDSGNNTIDVDVPSDGLCSGQFQLLSHVQAQLARGKHNLCLGR